MLEAWSGTMPHVSPFQVVFPVELANFQIRFIAKRYSYTDEKWTIQVGMERAFLGSA